jgi:hypothetical protein
MKIEEHAEHAEHAGEHGNKQAALLIAVLAALLAICEQQAKRADISVEENGILAADTWSEYQAKSIRSAVAHDLQRLAGTLDLPAQPERVTQRQTLLKKLGEDQDHYEHDPVSGKTVLAERARKYEEVRQNSLERAHTYDNAAASLELGIVLSTASVIANSKLLLRFGYVMGAIGLVLGLFGAIAPALVVF